MLTQVFTPKWKARSVGGMRFHEKFDRYLLDKDWSNETAGEKLGVSVTTVSRYRNGKFPPKQKVLDRLVEISGKPLNYWLNDAAGDPLAPTPSLVTEEEMELVRIARLIGIKESLDRLLKRDDPNPRVTIDGHEVRPGRRAVRH